MKWFKHFSSAHDNKGLTKVRMKYGAEGYAIYWYCLEIIAGDLGEKVAGEPKITFELSHDAEIIAYNLKVDSAKVEEIMKFMVNLGLFENSNGTITCLKLAKYLDKRTTRNEVIHQIIDQSSETVRDNPRLSANCPGLFPLDVDVDVDVDVDITTLSGKPDAPPKKTRKKTQNPTNKEAAEILEFLNEKTGRQFKPFPANLNPIKSCLKLTCEKTVRQVIAMKCRQWRDDPKMKQYLRPATLFGARNFANYEGELLTPAERGEAQ